MHCRTALTLLTTLLVAGPLAAQAEPARHVVEGARSRALAARERLGLDARHDFGIRRAVKDELGQTHTRMNQLFQGVRVWGGEMISHADAEGNELGTTLEVRKNIGISVEPTLGAREALAVAHTDLRPEGAYAFDPTTELVIYPEMREVNRPRRAGLEDAEGSRQVLRYHLAYHVHTEIENGDDTRHTDYMIDAHSGRIIKKWSTLRIANANGTGRSQFSGTVTLSTNSISGGYELRDMTRGTGGTFGQNVVTNMNKGTSGNGTVYTDADNTWGDGANYVSSNSTTSANGQTTAVDAAYGMQLTWDMLKNEYGRNGIDGRGKATYTRVHYDSNYVNAFWSDSCFCMTYGDGSTSQGFKTLTSLDVAAHEMGHGVCANSADLTYSGESGGLNEANSDIIAALAELYHRNGKVMPNSASNTDNAWKIGEQLSTNPLRWMYKPSIDGSSPNAWSSTLKNLDVHYSSGPGNRMFFFLSQGASGSSSSDYYSSYTPSGFTGIGPAKAGKIWYRALDVYMTSSTNYAGARTACINAAKDLYGAGGAEEAAVWNAFAAINVGSAWSGGTTDPTDPTDPTDTTATTVSVSASGTSGTITFNASASDAKGVTKVEWYVDGYLKGTDTTSPYSMTFNSTTLSNGNHSLVGKAYDAAGNVGTSTSYTFSVNNGTTPTGSELMVNGGFETGTTPWVGTTGAINAWSGQPAYEGTRNLWLGGNGRTATESLYQQVTIPSSATSATLSFYLHIDTAETSRSSAYDKCVVTVKNSYGTTLKTLATYSNLNKATGYQLRTFDLSAYKGQTVRVHFYMREDVSLQTSFVVDKVSLQVK